MARYHESSGNYLIRDTISQLFGDKMQNRSCVIPAKMGALAEVTEEHGLDFDTLLMGHTIYPFLTTFASPQNVEVVYQKLKYCEKGSFYARLGLFHYVAKPKYLRFCPLCFQEEIQLSGEGYWHRFHQTPGVIACEKHEVLLVESSISYEAKYDKEYKTASEEIGDIAFLQRIKKADNQSLSLMKEIQYLYQNNEFIQKIFRSYENSFADLFIKLLKDKGYATQNGTIRKKLFINKFQDIIGNDHLESLGYAVDKVQRPWIITLCRHDKITWDPIKYILMGRFLCGTFNDFLEVAKQNMNKVPQKQKIDYDTCKDIDVLCKYRKRWVNARKRALQDTRNCIIKQDKSAYTWLLRHDKDWLYENSPPPQKRGGNKSWANWEGRDLMYTMQVQSIAHDLFDSRDNKPIRVTKTSMCKQLGISLSMLANGQMPNLESELNKWSETQDQFCHRKVEWAISRYYKAGQPIITWKVLKAAGIRDENWKSYYSLVDSIATDRIMMS